MEVKPSSEQIEPDILYISGFLPSADADRLMSGLMNSIAWEQKYIRMFGRQLPMPRLTAWYGDPGAVYIYSGLTESPLHWTDELQEMRDRLYDSLGESFNSVLLNLYRTGEDSMGWHSDDERELGPEPVIASISLGAERRFDLMHRTLAHERRSYMLPHGSLLVMRGNTQSYWRHRLPKSPRIKEPRVNLTFRTILPGP